MGPTYTGRRWVSGFPAGWLCSLESSLLGVNVMLYSYPLKPQRHSAILPKPQPFSTTSITTEAKSYLLWEDVRVWAPKWTALLSTIWPPIFTSHVSSLMAETQRPGSCILTHQVPLPHKQLSEALPAPGKWLLESQAQLHLEGECPPKPQGSPTQIGRKGIP